MNKKEITVVVGIINNPPDKILLSVRQEGKEFAKLWEFPGGKIEPGENAEQALIREMHEELGIEVIKSQRLGELTHEYPNKFVHFKVFKIQQYKGVVKGSEGQHIEWMPFGKLSELDFPEANYKLITLIEPLVNHF